MIDIMLAIEVATTTAKDVYVPVPRRGIVVNAYATYSEETDADETITLAHPLGTVNLITPPADETAEGVRMTGVPDATYKDSVFDPDHATATYQRIKISVPNTFDTGGMIGLHIEFDDSAAVTQTST